MRSAIRIGERIYGPLIMTLMPQTPRPFQDFFRVLARRDERLPYRMSFLLEDGGLNMGLKPLLAAILAFTNADNKRLNNAVESLRALDLEGVCCVKFRICLCTWACVKESEREAHLLLRRRVAELSKAVQGWGTCDVTEALGDPLLGFTATLPGLMPSSPAPITAAPLQDAIGMWPLRSASPWREGSLLFRTQDGKIMPFAPNSSEQAAWIDLGVAPMGGGKSVFLNAFNFAFVTQAGLSRLPWLSIVDVGPYEAHRVTNNVSVAGQLQADMTTVARESRKWNLSIGLYTQSIDDIPKIITDELATTVVILGSGTEKSIANLSERFGLNGACRHALSRLGKPGRAGSHLIALFRTGSGMSQLVLSLTIGPQSLWAFSTTTEDVAIRNNLYQRLGPSEALRRLAARFPGGSAKAEVERRRRKVEDQSDADGEVVNVLLEIANEIAGEQ